MRIGIDISQIVYGTGVSEYTLQLVKNLLFLDKENDYVLFGGSLRRGGEIKRMIGNMSGNYTLKILPVPPTASDILWNRLHIFPVDNLIGKVDVLHSSDWSQPPTAAYKVTTVHDLAPILYPQFTHPRIVSVHKRRLDLVKKEVDMIIVPSQSTKEGLLDLGFSERKIQVIYEAASENFFPRSQDEVKRVKGQYGIKAKYLLTVGSGGRKNSERLTNAYKKIEDHDLELVIVGGSQAQSEDGVIHTGFVTDDDLAALYTGSEAFVYPSLYEGFGIPVLQAMACKTPVLASNTSSLPEVCGKAAVLIDPFKVESISDGISEVLRQRTKYVKLGIEQVKKFSWEKTARETLKVYNNAR